MLIASFEFKPKSESHSALRICKWTRIYLNFFINCFSHC
jgi:hypothetical protein